MMKLNRMLMVLSVVTVIALAGCSVPKGEAAATSKAVTCSGNVEKLFKKRCLGCHSAEKAKGKLVLEGGKAYGNLVGKASSKVPDMVLVEPGDPEASLLWHKLQGTQRQGKAMPLTPYGWKKLSPEDLELVRRWIASGAKP